MDYGYGGGSYGGGGYGGGGSWGGSDGYGGRGGYGRGGGRGGRDSGFGGGYNPPDWNKNPNAEEFCKLFLGGLSPDSTEDTVKEYFGQYGDIVDCIVMRDPQTKKPRGFGFVTFKLSSSVQDAQSDRPHKVDGKELETRRATPKAQQGPEGAQKNCTDKLFIGGVKDEMTEDLFMEVFSEHGDVVKVDIVKDKATGRGKGFAFVTFKDTDSVDKCNLIQKFKIAGKPVSAKKAEDKSQQGMMGGRGGGRGGRGGGRGGYGGGGYGGGYDGYGGYGDGYDGYGDDYGGGFGSDYQGYSGGGPMKSGGYGGSRSSPYGSGGGGYSGNYGGGGGGYGGGYDGYGGGGSYGGYGYGGGGYGKR